MAPTPTAVPDISPSATPSPTPTSEPTSPAPEGPADNLFRLTILHNNDGESDLVDLGSDLPDYGGAARFATVVQREKREAVSAYGDKVKSEVVMVSSGDNFLAGPEFSASLAEGVFFDAVALGLIGYDAITLGNHDFDYGPEVLAGFIRQAENSDAPFLSANLDFSGEPVLQELFDEGRITGSMVAQKDGESIGIVGATTPDLRSISSPRHVIVMRDVAARIQAEVDKLEADGVNKIILVSHLQGIEVEIALLGQLSGVDVAVAGGGDELLANPEDLLIPDDSTPYGPYPIIATDADGTEVPVVTTAGQYGYLGKLVVLFDADGNLTEIDEEASGPIRIAGGDNPDAVEPAVQVQQQVVEPVNDFLMDLAVNIIGESLVDLDGRRSEVRSRDTNQGNLIADALHWQATQLASAFGVAAPDVALQNGGGIRNDTIIAAGPISELESFDMIPFPNFVTVLEGIPREQFKEVLENAVSRAVEGDTPGGTGRFTQVSGFSFEWSAAGTAQTLSGEGAVEVPGSRIRRVTLDDNTSIVDGGAVVPGLDITVATINFLARGGDEYPYQGAPYTIMGVTYQQALANYIRDPDGLNGTITAEDYPTGGGGRITRLP